MHSHMVFFWLWGTISDHERGQFERSLVALTADPNVVERRIGKPSTTGRSVIDSSYDYGVVLRFETLAAHDAYQAGQPLQHFLETCEHMWSRVKVYDKDEISLNT
ncbi:MAG: Dabb family protein [Pseudomonadota bacterium]